MKNYVRNMHFELILLLPRLKIIKYLYLTCVFTRCHMVDSSFKKLIFTYCSQKQTLRRHHFLAPHGLYFNEKNTKKLLEKRTTSSKFLGLSSPTNCYF